MLVSMLRPPRTAVTLAPQVISILLQSVESEARRSGQEARLQRARRIARWLPFPLRRLLFRSLLERLGGALELISSGGAMLSPELQQAWELFGVRIVQGYGTTEAAVVCGHLRSRQRKGTVGPPLAGILIVDALLAARDLDFREREMVLTGFVARVFLHELDHLDGRVFVDRMVPESRAKIEAGLEELKQRYAARAS